MNCWIRVLFTVWLPVILITGCTTGSSFKQLDPYIFLNDHSSKVWLVSKLMKDNRDYTPLRFENRQMIVFHETGNAYFYRLREFGTKPGLKMNYWMDKSKDLFTFESGNTKWQFDIRRLSRKKIILRPRRNSYPYTIVLIPFPEY